MMPARGMRNNVCESPFSWGGFESRFRTETLPSEIDRFYSLRKFHLFASRHYSERRHLTIVRGRSHHHDTTPTRRASPRHPSDSGSERTQCASVSNGYTEYDHYHHSAARNDVNHAEVISSYASRVSDA